MENNLNKEDLPQVLDVNSYNLEGIIKALDKAALHKNNEIYYVIINSKEELNKMKAQKNEGLKSKILIPLQDGFEVINKTCISYCEADDNYTKVYLKNGEKYLVSKTLKYFEDVLGTDNFVRIHKSYLVNINEIVKYYRKGKTGRIKLSNGQYLPVSASKKAALMAYFKSYT
ncbi:LytTR family DNA-binding domain-containing protein [Seonamhaeicola sp.]|uniref:LytR/AlgR family response regulator transcription factor n=1 Tax=Seonamhaeicola sp. TaxID=1912245 RepID=UPI0034482D6E